MTDTPASTDDLDLPPPPEKPDPSECCGAGCSPCVLEAYEEELAEWGRRVAEIRAAKAKNAP